MKATKTKTHIFRRSDDFSYFHLRFSAFSLCWTLILLFAFSAFAQNLPDKIRGYKVYKTQVSVRTETDKSEKKDKSEAFVKIGEPELIDVSLTGVTFELTAEISALEQNGAVDFLTFHDFRVNGLNVEIEEYKEPFVFKKNQPIKLPKPVKIFLGAAQTLRGALKEMKDLKNEWLVTGRIFVFGRFKKFGFSFKRVIPVEINIKIKNPLQKKNLLQTQPFPFLIKIINFA